MPARPPVCACPLHHWAVVILASSQFLEHASTMRHVITALSVHVLFSLPACVQSTPPSPITQKPNQIKQNHLSFSPREDIISLSTGTLSFLFTLNPYACPSAWHVVGVQ